MGAKLRVEPSVNGRGLGSAAGSDWDVVIVPPETQYAKTEDGAYLAYQLVGDGPVDLILPIGGGSNVEMGWEIEPLTRVTRRLASFSRVILFDQRGAGLSDPPRRGDEPSLEERAQDMLAVLDAAESTQAAVLANNVAGLVAIFFAASYPTRVSGLVLHGCYARLAYSEDYRWGVPVEVLSEAVSRILPNTPKFGGFDYTAPNASSEFRELMVRYWRSSASPSQARATAEAAVFGDVRSVLPAIQAPTLVLYRRGDRLAGKPHARFLAEHIPTAKLVELPGNDNLLCVGDFNPDLEEIEEFLTGTSHVPDTDRVLATVLFTDIVGSTERAAELGDRGWRELIDSHDRTVRRQLERFRAREISTRGDGFLAIFDGPGRGIECACAIRDSVAVLGIEVRAGLHTGEIELRGDDVAGLAVHIGARVSATAGAGEVLVSGAIPPLMAGSGMNFQDRGEHELKGVPGSWRLYAVVD